MKLAVRLLIGLLFGTLVVVPMLFLGTQVHSGRWSPFSVGFWFLYALLVGGLEGLMWLPFALAAWACFSGGHAHWRLVAVAAPFTLVMMLEWATGPWGLFEGQPLFMQMSTIVAGAPFLFLRACRFRLTTTPKVLPLEVVSESGDPDEHALAQGDSESPPQLQFSIANMLSWTAAIAVLLSLWSTGRIFISDETLERLLAVHILIWPFAAFISNIAIFWVVFSSRSFRARVGGFVIYFAMQVWPLFLGPGFDLTYWVTYMTGILLGTLLLIPIFLPARLAGFRLVRLSRAELAAVEMLPN